MKPATLEGSIGMDRLATRNEVRCALLVSAQGPVEWVGLRDDLRGMDDFADHVLDTVWEAFVEDMLGSISN